MNNPTCAFLVADLGQPVSLKDFDGNTDVVVSARVAHSLPSEEAVRVFLNNIYRILRTGGKAVISVGSTHDWKFAAKENTGYTEDRSIYLVNYAGVMDLPSQLGINTFNLHLFKKEEFANLLTAADLRIDRVFPYHDESGYKHLREKGLVNHYLCFEATKV